MFEIIKFIFEDILHFIGFIIILGVIFEGIQGLIEANKK